MYPEHACLIDRSPAPVMALKSNRSGLWRHIIGTCRRLKRLCANFQTLSHDMIKLQLSQHFCRVTRVSCRIGVTLSCDFFTLKSCNI